MIDPERAAVSLNKYLYGLVWFRGASLSGIGTTAAIEVHTSSMAEAESFRERIGHKWQGYPVRIRRAST